MDLFFNPCPVARGAEEVNIRSSDDHLRTRETGFEYDGSDCSHDCHHLYTNASGISEGDASVDSCQLIHVMEREQLQLRQLGSQRKKIGLLRSV